MEVTKWLKPSASRSRKGDRTSVRAATRVNAEQASKTTRQADPTMLSGKAGTLGEMTDDDAQPLHRGSGGSTYTRKARATREAPSVVIGVVRAKRITDAWAEQKIVREIMVFLHSNGVGTARAVRISKTYGADAVQVTTENPYRLARDIEASVSRAPMRSR